MRKLGLGGAASQQLYPPRNLRAFALAFVTKGANIATWLPPAIMAAALLCIAASFSVPIR